MHDMEKLPEIGQCVSQTQYEPKGSALRTHYKPLLPLASDIIPYLKALTSNGHVRHALAGHWLVRFCAPVIPDEDAEV